ncbi:hypothetical protein Misp05_39210 [Micromonospora sp. NBRC 107095]|nr:hypothetical protein Misp05_39210 [Micromonospora sp. NBRC 107095]
MAVRDLFGLRLVGIRASFGPIDTAVPRSGGRSVRLVTVAPRRSNGEGTAHRGRDTASAAERRVGDAGRPGAHGPRRGAADRLGEWGVSCACPHAIPLAGTGAPEFPDTMGTMLIAFSITPLGGDDSVGDLVAEAVRVVRASGLPNRTDAMFTTVEGEWDEVMAVVKRAVDVVAARAPRVSVVLKADVRPGVTDALTGKIARIEARLAEG